MSQFATDFATGAVGDLLAYFGQEITFTPHSGSAQTINAIVTGEGFSARETDPRLHGYEAIIKIAKSDVATVTVNGDVVTLPGHLFGSDDATEASLRVSRIFEDLSDGAMWVLGVGKGRRT